MLNKEKNKKLLKISSEDFINNLEKRGNKYDELLKQKLYELENDHKENNVRREDLYNKYNIPENVSELIDFFQILDEYNINYINYIIIYNDMEIQKLKNFFRYTMIKWNRVKNNLNDIHKDNNFLSKINNFQFQDIVPKINNNNNVKDVKILILNKFKEFAFINDNTFPNIYIIFLINTLQEYLYPI